MNRTIIKRNGDVEAFDPHKLIKWAEWASNENVDWLDIVSSSTRGLPSQISSRDLQKRLIDACNAKNNWSYSVMANKLYATMTHKDMYPDGHPSVAKIQNNLYAVGLMKKMDYNHYEMDIINSYIDHNKDLNMPLFSFEYLMHKYGLQNRSTKTLYETPQFIYMRIAMEVCSDIKLNRLENVLYAYNLLSNKSASVPTPDYTTLGSNSSIAPSCCLIHALDNKDSIGIYHHIAYTMTCIGAGIGGNMDVRSINDPVRNGSIIHQGQLPYLASLGKYIRSSKQGPRGGSGTQYVSCFSPEIMDLIRLQHPYTSDEKRNRDLHIAVMYNQFFMQKVAKNEKVVLFNAFTAPELNEAFYGHDTSLFESLYAEYVLSLGDKAKLVSAREIMKLAGECWNEVSTVYPAFITNANTHTPFKDKIRSLNLCVEVSQPTYGYSNISELLSIVELKDWHKGEQEPEISLCFLGGVNVAEYISDEDYLKIALFLLRKIDYTIDNCDYPFPHLALTAKARRNAGVGIGGLAAWMAKNNLKYNSEEGRAEIHRIAERHSYFMIKASLELAKEKGPAKWMYKTKWPDGWLPIDTYNKNVDSITPPVYHYDWESLRAEIIANGGIRNSCLVDHMPMESSSKALGVTNGPYPIRDVALFKTDGGSGIDWLAYKHDDPSYKYQLAWELSNEDIVKFYAILQKFADGGISADFWVDRTNEFEISEVEHNIVLFLLMNKYGLKGGYYKNSKTSSMKPKEKELCVGGACDV